MQQDALTKAGIPHQVCGDETLFDILFTDMACLDYRSAKHKSPDQAAVYNAALRQHGILKSPSKLYPSLALTEADLTQTHLAVTHAVEAMSRLG